MPFSLVTLKKKKRKVERGMISAPFMSKMQFKLQQKLENLQHHVS